MTNVAVMGPPPSPKEPRRSGRRSVPSASTSKSPVGSPTSESAPKVKENPNRPSLSASTSNGKSKRSKQEDHDDTLEDTRKNGVNGNGSARSKRKGKEKEKPSSALEALGDVGNSEIPQPDAPGQEGAVDGEEDDEETGITRCICGDEEPESAEFMAQCEMCKAWQHGQCMGFANIASLPQHYYCEQCRPDLYTELLKKHAKRARQSSTASHHTSATASHAPRSSRSHSPIHHQKPAKRRNTMNSRDAAFEESFQALLEATAVEAAAQEVHAATVVTKENGDMNGHDGEPEIEVAPNSRRKRKRSDDDATTTKRTRSTSIASDRTSVANTVVARDPTPINGGSNNNAKASTSMGKSSSSRNRRGTARKSQAQDLASVEGDEVPSAGNTGSARRQATSRAKATTANDNATRRAQANPANGHGANAASHSNTTNARAYHHTHAYAVSQQPLFTSWNLPDYLAHLEPMLPTGVPQPLEVRGSGVDFIGRESLERTTERGVKVKWPSKRMSVGDMNKRVRALVEWVGREQASALERSRRREALERALREARSSNMDGQPGSGDHPPGSNGEAITNHSSPADAVSPEKRLSSTNGPPPNGLDSGLTTMKLMEELMEELIGFQERFGPGAKTKERERRTALA
ncbi:uncharacterized protein FIBRA_00687 [Fibroporia radiculosa]|uniref:Zinc finger PHD-type domain-containing protein n=1 Tax=Fibroporia radiculosa TaxID=599839 RepID=J4GIC8_9APHY|nr:uncharacterized protein FIBRA_00687 [Fibroporia radiculosa]CCL98685.1 predicted protein [Fibroporia radiculosa]